MHPLRACVSALDPSHPALQPLPQRPGRVRPQTEPWLDFREQHRIGIQFTTTRTHAGLLSERPGFLRWEDTAAPVAMEEPGEHDDQAVQLEKEATDPPTTHSSCRAQPRAALNSAFFPEESSTSPAAPGSAGDADQAMAVASSPVVREQSGEALAAIQPAAAACGANVVAVERLASAADAARGGGDAAGGRGVDTIDSARAEREGHVPRS